MIQHHSEVIMRDGALVRTLGLRTAVVAAAALVSGSTVAAAAVNEVAGEGASAVAGPADRAAGAVLAFTMSPRIGAERVTGRLWGGYDGGHRQAIGEAVVDGNLNRFVALRAGVSSLDLWGGPSATLGGRVALLREESSAVDLGVGLFYQPHSIMGDGLLAANVSLGKTLGSVSSFLTLGYGQDPEGDDFMGSTSLGAVLGLTGHLLVGLDSRARFQILSSDPKFQNLAMPAWDFCAGMLLDYRLGAFDLTLHGGIAGVSLNEPQAPGSGPDARSSLHLGPLALVGIGAVL